MKRTFAFLLVLMLLCPAALADTVREQVNAPLEHKERTVAPRADPIFMWTLRSSCRKRKQSRSTRRLPAYPTKWNLNCWRTLRLERAGIRWKEAKRTQATLRALHMRKVIQPKLLKACTSIASTPVSALLPCFISRRTFPMCKPNTQYRIMQRTHMLSPAWSISPTGAISEKNCHPKQTQGPRQMRLYPRCFRIFSSGGQRIKRI